MYPPVVPFGPGHRLFPAPCAKDTHHYGTNHRAFDHPPQSRVVIHVPAAEGQTERKNRGHVQEPGDPQDNVPGSSLTKKGSQAGCRPCQPHFFRCCGPSFGSLVQARSPASQSSRGSWARATFPLQTQGAASVAFPWTFFLPSLKGTQSRAQEQLWAQEHGGVRAQPPRAHVGEGLWPGLSGTYSRSVIEVQPQHSPHQHTHSWGPWKRKRRGPMITGKPTSPVSPSDLGAPMAIIPPQTGGSDPWGILPLRSGVPGTLTVSHTQAS